MFPPKTMGAISSPEFPSFRLVGAMISPKIFCRWSLCLDANANVPATFSRANSAADAKGDGVG
jgi:hypothetical protein